MPAMIRECDALDVADLLQRLAGLDDRKMPTDLAPEEIAIVSKHRRDRIVTELANKGIEIIGQAQSAAG